MKKLIFVFVTGLFLVSCSNKEVSSPGAANQSVFFKNANVLVENLQATQVSSDAVSLSFSTVYENNIRRIELMSGATPSTFCSIEGENVDGNSASVQAHSFQDTNLKGSTMYYMLRFEDNLGNWTYSNYYTVNVH